MTGVDLVQQAVGDGGVVQPSRCILESRDASELAIDASRRAPVTQAAAPARMDMTAPVTQAGVAGGMRVQLREVPAGTWAVIRDSGTWSQANYLEHLAELKASLAAQGVATQGEPVLARYNPPFTPWFRRRNEIWLALR
jgi:hypothetical protein